jgi:hypothetical protein
MFTAWMPLIVMIILLLLIARELLPVLPATLTRPWQHSGNLVILCVLIGLGIVGGGGYWAYRTYMGPLRVESDPHRRAEIASQWAFKKKPEAIFLTWFARFRRTQYAKYEQLVPVL